MPEVRQAVRVVVIDPADRVLLLWHSHPHDDEHWAPPGGGVETSEDLLQAAARELEEEVGLTDVPLTRPLWTWQHEFSFQGRVMTQHETYFAARIPATEVAGSPELMAADGITSARWWTLAELAACPDEVWPRDFVAHLSDALANGLEPDEPVQLKTQ